MSSSFARFDTDESPCRFSITNGGGNRPAETRWILVFGY
jgi:hypothetical protein